MRSSATGSVREGLRASRGLLWRESLIIGTLVNTRGLIELVILNIGLDRKISSPTLFSIMVLIALATMTAPLLSIVNPVVPASAQEVTRLDQQPVRKAKAATYLGPPMTDSQCAVFHFDIRDIHGDGDPSGKNLI